MLSKNQILLLFLLSLFTGVLWGQDRCGTQHDAEQYNRIIDEYYQRKAQGAIVKPRATIYVPIKFHRIADSQGNGRVRYNAVLDNLWRLNQDYFDQEIQFCLRENSGELINDFNNSLVYDDPRSGSGELILQAQRVDNAINVYLVNSIPPLTGTGTTLGYYTSNGDWIVQRKNQANDFSNTLSHEVGHFFSLAHPHVGWESEPFDCIGDAPFSNPGGIRTEFADGSNCQDAGDRLCDTPADYNGLEYDNNCPNWAMVCNDPNGEPISPMLNNQMSYFPGACAPFTFTPEQKSMIITDYNRFSRSYLRPSVTPTFDSIMSAPTAISPSDNGQVLNGTAITIEWAAVDNAEFYIIELSDHVGFRAGFEYHEAIVYGTSMTFDNLKENDTYYWRVRAASNCYSPPSALSTTFRFTTEATVAVNDIDNLDRFVAYPNPLDSNRDLSIELSVKNDLPSSIVEIINISGTIVQHMAVSSIQSGNTTITLPDTGILPAGQYFVRIKNSEGTAVRRFIKL